MGYVKGRSVPSLVAGSLVGILCKHLSRGCNAPLLAYSMLMIRRRWPRRLQVTDATAMGRRA